MAGEFPIDHDEMQRIFDEAQEERRQAKITSFWADEAIRIKAPRPQWDLMHSYELEEIIIRAKELGWAENKVQVKSYPVTPDTTAYYIEPYEEDCECPGLLKYEDYRP